MIKSVLEICNCS